MAEKTALYAVPKTAPPTLDPETSAKLDEELLEEIVAVLLETFSVHDIANEILRQVGSAACSSLEAAVHEHQDASGEEG